jgi:hypothetical protein
MKKTIVCDLKPCCLVDVCRRFGGTHPPFSGLKSNPNKHTSSSKQQAEFFRSVGNILTQHSVTCQKKLPFMHKSKRNSKKAEPLEQGSNN